MRTDVNNLYTEWFEAKPEAKEQAREELGEALYHYIKLVIRKQFPKWARYLLIDSDGIGEAAHNIFARIDKYDSTKGSFAQWTYGVTCNACIDLLRQRRGRGEVQYFGNENPVFSDGHSAKLYLQQLRSQLTEEENELIDLKLNGFANDGVAQSLGIELEAMKKRWTRLQDKLRTLLGGMETV